MTNKPILNKRSMYHQGYFTPNNPHKYIGNPTNIVYRSKWERIFLNYLDKNPRIIRYASEELIIPYISPIDHKQHRYYIDFYLEVLQHDNSVKKYLVEIKPYDQTIPPKKKKSGIDESYIEKTKTYLINQAKWEATKELCKQKGYEFMIITENELFTKYNKINKKKRKRKYAS